MFEFITKAWIDVKAYFRDKEQIYNRIIHFARLSVLMNTAIGLGKIMMGFYNFSFIFFIGGFYNISLSLAKALAIKGYCESKGEKIWPFIRQDDNRLSEKGKSKEYHYYQLVGMVVILASLAYMISSTGVFAGGRSSTQFSMATVVKIGSITAFEIILSLQGVFARRREKEPILEAIKLTSLISSLIGLTLMQTAILGHSGRESNLYFDLSGIFLGAVSFCIGVYMIVSIRRKKVTGKPAKHEG